MSDELVAALAQYQAPVKSFGEKRRALRNMRKAVRLVGERMVRQLHWQMFDDVQWLLGRMKHWDPEAKRFYRSNDRFVVPNLPEPHLVLCGVPVFREGRFNVDGAERVGG